MDQLRLALDRSRGGRGAIWMLAGDPGIGKSRTAQELAAQAAEQGFDVLWGRCLEVSGAPPYWPWLQAIRAFVATHTAETLEAFGARAGPIAEIVPELRDKAPSIPLPERLQDADAARFRLFDAMAHFFKEATRAKPILLVLDNLHVADRPSLLLLEFVAQDVGDARLLILGTYRDSEIGIAHPLSITLGELSRETGSGALRRTKLRGFQRDEVARFLEAIAGAPPPSATVSALHSQTEGNPLFLSEVAHMLIEEGILGHSEATDGPGPSPPSTVRIPEGVKQVIGRRITRLSPAAVQMLTAAAVVGREFTFAELERVFSEPGALDILEGIEEGMRAHVIEEVAGSPSTFQFTHILIRETLYDEIAGPRRALMHRRAAESIEQLYGSNPGPQLSRLAYHYAEASQGGNFDKAVEFATRAAQRAEGMYAHEQAAQHYEAALQMLGKRPSDAARRCELLLGLGDALEKSGDYPRARQTFAEAADLARSPRLTDAFVEAALGFERSTWRPGFPGGPATRLLEEALDMLDEAPSGPRAAVLGALGRSLTFVGRWEDGARAALEGVEMARATRDQNALHRVLQGRTEALFAPQIARELVARAEEIIADARGRGELETVSDTLSWTISHYLLLGEGAALQKNLQLMRESTPLQQAFLAYGLAITEATSALIHGEFARADELIGQALLVGQRFRGIDAHGVFGLQMFLLRRAQGRLGEIEPALGVFVHQRDAASVWRPGLAAIYAELGKLPEARAQFEALAIDDFGDLPRDALWSMCLSFLADVCAYLCDRKRASVLYAMLSHYDGYCIVVGGGIGFAGAASRYLGKLASTMEDWSAADRHFEQATVLERKAGASAELAQTQYAWAASLVGRGRAANRERAQELVSLALTSAASLDMRALVTRAQALREELVETPANNQRPEYPDALTQREIEVLRLLASGKTNQEIAEQLVISANTVAHHVASIIGKIGAPNRTAAAAYALSRGLA